MAKRLFSLTMAALLPRILALASPVRSSCLFGHPLTLQPAGNSSVTHLEDA